MSNTYLSQKITKMNIASFTESEFKNAKPNEIWDITNIKPINLFIGSNSSGKSRLARQILTNSIELIDIYNYSNDIKESFIINVNSGKITPRNTGYPTDVTNAVKEKLLNSIPSLSITSSIFNDLVSLSREAISERYYSPDNSYKDFINSCIDQNKLKEYIDYNSLKDKGFDKIYIPILRGLRPVLTNSNDTSISNKFNSDLYKNRTIKDYKNLKDIEIFTGYELYSQLVNSLLGNQEQRHNVQKYEKYLSKHFFNNKQISITPNINEDVVYLTEEGKEERPIYSLGDGIQAIILLTFPVFLAKKPTMFFIEEPELNIHAGLQRALIDALSSHPKHMYFMTTHSNHFIDLAQERNDVSLHRVFQEKQDNGKYLTSVDSLADNTQLLDDLGVRASSVLLANCSIWVEGITDKLYLKAYMQKYLKEAQNNDTFDKEKLARLQNYKENLHYIFTEYQGSNITHWYFSDDENEQAEATKAKALSPNIFLIADADIDEKGNRVKELESNLGDNFELLQFKEIENYIPVEILRQTALSRWQTFSGKGESSQNLEDITQSIYARPTKGIGYYLEQYISKDLKSMPNKKRTFFEERSKSTTGTIKDKVTFCRTAVEHMNNDDIEWKLTPKLTNLCEKIWDHIDSNNNL
ncbi:hypothetical protein A6D98_05960 [Aliivibrio fischeri]|uniref:ATP-dependent nuclease n=1 Tax=Aliivibrio fischeri TaxID=668 RepID=UPI00080DFB9B|nr:ATP-binding protein [Aliivibrio fischeri]OCH05914.1 hypothetical protein A6E10_07560 [Aliivibrio fischeri]OCH27480.1 hypothetical protein A6E13_06955 [Aliivibrio fischeri]OCH62543.1 hypothetical protein A6D98_05960 [Aliivibrio fischeri]